MPWRTSRALAVAALLAAAGLGACDAALGIQVLPYRAFSYANAECSACVAQACSREESACATDPACAALYGCFAACATDDWGCRQACFAQGDVTAPVFAALDGCRRSSCAAGCFASGAGFEGFGDCGSCVAVQCGNQLAQCVGDASCDRIFGCYGALHSVDPATITKCGASDPQNVAASAGRACLDAVVRTTCPSCSVHRNWTCVGDYTWPPAMSELPVPCQFQIQSVLSMPGADLRIDACGAPPSVGSAPCGESWAHATSNEAGFASFDLPSEGFLGGIFQVSGSPNWLPAIYYVGHPVTEPGFRVLHAPTMAETALLGELGFPGYNPNLGMVWATVADCYGRPALDVSIDPVLGIVPWYFRNGWPTAPKNASATDATGQVFFFGVPAGAVVLTARDALGSVVSTQTVNAMPGGWTTANLPPNAQ